jgi:uncharacterized protein (DUF1330 family)
MMSAYLLADVDWHDVDAYRASGYLEKTMETVARFGGRYIVSGGSTKVLEGDWARWGTVVIEFRSMEHLMDWYTSEDYKPLIELRQSLADSRLVAAEGLSGA